MTAPGVRTPLWWDPSAGGVDVHAGPARPPLRGDLSVDVAVVGAGYTGLWTAYYLARLDPSLRIAVLEREVAGFGASGRNGGWCSALFPVPPDALARRAGREAAVAMHRAARDAVEEVGRVAEAEGIDCAFSRGGTVSLARNRDQLRRARHEVDAERRLGLGGHVMLSAREAADRCGATRVLGGTYTPHCAALHPARLVRSLATAVERRGVTVYEGTPVTALGPGRAVTPHGTVRAEVVVRATEGYTAGLPGLRRALLPVYSLMVATEPLPQAFWSVTGLARRETFADHRRLVIYGQRTADDRLAFGGRGAPYHWASSVRPAHDHVPAVAAALRRTLEDLFPALRPVRLTHAWGGPLGVPRDWHPSVGLDRAGGTAWAGGYIGDGVAASNLAGRTLADLITGTDSALVRLPWVGHRSRRWEPEPLRWVGVNAARLLVGAADRLADRPTRPRRTSPTGAPSAAGR